MSALRTSVRSAALVVVAVACSANDGAQNDAPWGTEAVSFFEELTVEHSDNDFYGVLDFYTPPHTSRSGAVIFRAEHRWPNCFAGIQVTSTRRSSACTSVHRGR